MYTYDIDAAAMFEDRAPNARRIDQLLDERAAAERQGR
jgi:hypothetical protein